MKTKLCINYLFLNTEKPTAKVTPKPYPTLTQGDKLRLTCNVNKATINITWKKDGDPVKERAVIETQLDETTSYLIIAKACYLLFSVCVFVCLFCLSLLLLLFFACVRMRVWMSGGSL